MKTSPEGNSRASSDPHTTRRQLILAQHPEIKSLMKHDPHFKWQVIALVLVQISSVILLRNITSWFILLLIGYNVTGIISHTLFHAIHEIAHGHAFGPDRTHANLIFGMFVNLPLIYPVSVAQKQHHFKHHRYPGRHGIDQQAPSDYEKKTFRTPLRKLLWLIVEQPIRAFEYPPAESQRDIKFKWYAVCNVVSQILFSLILAYYCGIQMVLYLAISPFMVLCLHPIMGGRLSDHSYLFKGKDLEVLRERDGMSDEELRFDSLGTYSYYGPLNNITFNAGYHVEHHDFPSIPGSKLPLVRKLAPEFYKNRPYYTSKTRAIVNFIMDPSFGPWSLFARADTDPTMSYSQNPQTLNNLTMVLKSELN